MPGGELLMVHRRQPGAAVAEHADVDVVVVQGGVVVVAGDAGVVRQPSGLLSMFEIFAAKIT